MNLNEVRNQINQIDYEIIKLLNERFELCVRTKKLKHQIKDEQREKEVLANIGRFSHGLISKEFSTKIFSQIMNESRTLQSQKLVLTAFQGEHGAYSEVAAQKFDSNWVTIPCRQFLDVLSGVAQGRFDLGIIPVENSIEGAVTEVNDLMIYDPQKIYIIGEIRLPVHHCLLGMPETDYRELKLVYSHPQALAQCRDFIQRHRLSPQPFYDTAGAARMLSLTRPQAAAAIASRLCAELYNLDIIKENIEDQVTNFTRFLIISHKKNNPPGNKCSIIFSTRHQAGQLHQVLQIFADHKINLTRIESRPYRDDPGNYVFLLDFKGSDRDEKVKKILDEIKEKTIFFKFLGCYQEAL